MLDRRWKNDEEKSTFDDHCPERKRRITVDNSMGGLTMVVSWGEGTLLLVRDSDLWKYEAVRE